MGLALWNLSVSNVWFVVDKMCQYKKLYPHWKSPAWLNHELIFLLLLYCRQYSEKDPINPMAQLDPTTGKSYEYAKRRQKKLS